MKDKLKEEIRKTHCPTCGSQRCSGQDDWIEGCEHFKNEDKPEILKRLLSYVGKTMEDRISNPCITKRETIELANYVAELETKVKQLQQELRVKNIEKESSRKAHHYYVDKVAELEDKVKQLEEENKETWERAREQYKFDLSLARDRVEQIEKQKKFVIESLKTDRDQLEAKVKQLEQEVKDLKVECEDLSDLVCARDCYIAELTEDREVRAKPIALEGLALILAHKTYDKNTAEHQQARDKALDMFVVNICNLIYGDKQGE